ncbi:hypothetical protein [Halomarina litorea]|uniref:hypothetical protein n=1 Tax=Halomarina litorea TaxID=2961595 RepID=UPI0020C388F4|nr:hypothetical protein [Halomarina sp. BCD28]
MSSNQYVGTGAGRAFTRRTALRGAGALVAGAAVLSGPAAAYPRGTVLWGDPEAVGNGYARTFAEYSPSGHPQAVGFLLRRDVFDGLPAETAEYHLHLPAGVDDAGRTPIPFTFAGLDWNPQGHDPIPIYGGPHFDFHLYISSEETTESIPFGIADYEIPPDQMPEGVVTAAALGADRVVVPAMGEHLVDPRAPEFNGQPFTHTFIWGAWEPDGRGVPDGEGPHYTGDGVGELTFMEPMATVAFLRDLDGTVGADIPMPAVFDRAGYYPTRYVIRRWPGRDAYTVALTRFRWFDGAH